MGYSQTHKAETHAKLVKLAGRVLRKNGPEQLAVVELMHAAGLTHGGFYAHFKSREVLLVEALGGILEEAQQKYHRLGDGFTASPCAQELYRRLCVVRASGQSLGVSDRYAWFRFSEAI